MRLNKLLSGKSLQLQKRNLASGKVAGPFVDQQFPLVPKRARSYVVPRGEYHKSEGETRVDKTWDSQKVRQRTAELPPGE